MFLQFLDLIKAKVIRFQLINKKMNRILSIILLMFISINMMSQCYTSISTKGFHNVAISSDGSIWSWGRNNYNQIGNNSNLTQYSPIQITTDLDWIMISLGTWNSTAIKNDGSAWYWGWNYYGTAGLPNTPIPLQITGIGNGNLITTGLNNTAVIKSDGTLWIWGWNEYGTIGDGTNNSSSSPIQVGTDTNWKYVSIGDQHISAIKTDGSLWAWGRNNSGQIGNNIFGEQTTPLRIGTANDWEKSYSGYASNLAIKTDGSLWAWGWNAYGQLGDGTSTNRTTPIQIGSDTDWVDIAITTHSLAIKSNGTLWAWGYNNYGKLGLGSTANQIVIPTQVGSDSDWMKAIPGFEHTIALKDNGTLWAWGHNDVGQLGDGTNIDKTTPIQIGTTCTTLSIVEKENHEFFLFPNPTKGIFTINLNNQQGAINYTLTTLEGRIVKQINNVTTNNVEVDLTNESKGIYLLRINEANTNKIYKIVRQ